jgi:hypothetical protein
MSLRDYFAAAALQGLLASPRIVHGPDGGPCGLCNDYTAVAYVYADAMLAARARRDGGSK